jgi:hypothetical protein
MALNITFLLLVLPMVLILLVAFLLPTKDRIESNPSMAFRGGRRSVVNFVALMSVIIGLILIGLGATQNLDPLVGELNAVHIGGAELLVLSVMLIAASTYYKKRIMRAKRGEDEEVVDVQAIGTTYLDETGVAVYEEPTYYDTPSPYEPPRREPRERIPPSYGSPRREPPERSPPPYGPPRREPPERSPPPYGPPRREPPERGPLHHTVPLAGSHQSGSPRPTGLPMTGHAGGDLHRIFNRQGH